MRNLKVLNHNEKNEREQAEMLERMKHFQMLFISAPPLTPI